MHAGVVSRNLQREKNQAVSRPTLPNCHDHGRGESSIARPNVEFTRTCAGSVSISQKNTPLLTITTLRSLVPLGSLAPASRCGRPKVLSALGCLGSWYRMAIWDVQDVLRCRASYDAEIPAVA